MIEDLLSKKQKKRRKRNKYFLWAFAFLIVYFFFLGIGWIVYRSPVFRVNKVIITGNSDIATSDVMSLLDSSVIRGGDLITNQNSGTKALLGFKNMLVWPATLPASDTALIPQIATLTISKDYWAHTITVNVAERQPFAIWCLMPSTQANGNEKCYSFDQNGVIFEKSFDTEGSLVLVVHDYAQKDLNLNGEILPDQFVQNAISILNVIKASNVNVAQVALNDLTLEQINITTNNGPSLYFSLRFPADNDLPVLQSLMSGSGFSKFQYVDFTVQNRAYYK